MITPRLLSVVLLLASTAVSLPNAGWSKRLDGMLLDKRACTCCLPAATTKTATATKTVFVNFMTSVTQFAGTNTNTLTPSASTATVSLYDYLVISTKVLTSTVATVPGTTITQISIVIPTVTTAGPAPVTTVPSTFTVSGPVVTGTVLPPAAIAPQKRAVLVTTSNCGCINSACLQTASAATTTTVTVTLTTLLSKQVSNMVQTTITGLAATSTVTTLASRSITEYDEVAGTATAAAVTSTSTSTGASSTIYTTPPAITAYSTTRVTATPSTTFYYSMVTSYPPNYAANGYYGLTPLQYYGVTTEDQARAQCAQVCAEEEGNDCQDFFIEHVNGPQENYWYCGYYGIASVGTKVYTNIFNPTVNQYSHFTTDPYTYSGYQVFAHVASPTSSPSGT